jgi:hypothetical protein
MFHVEGRLGRLDDVWLPQQKRNGVYSTTAAPQRRKTHVCIGPKLAKTKKEEVYFCFHQNYN